MLFIGDDNSPVFATFMEVAHAVAEFIEYKHDKAAEFLSPDGGLVDMMRPKGQLERMAHDTIRKEMAAAKLAQHIRRLFASIRAALHVIQY